MQIRALALGRNRNRMTSNMQPIVFDKQVRRRIRDLVLRVIDGEAIDRASLLWLFSLREPRDIYELLIGAYQIRESFHGRRTFLCSIYNVKSGGCPENCKFCAQSAWYTTHAPRYNLVDGEEVLRVAKEVSACSVGALALVAAWPTLTPERLVRLEPVIQRVKSEVRLELHASLGMINDFHVAARLSELGLVCYHHNLETSPRYFSQICTTHTFQQRVTTVRLAKDVGLRVCSGGIIGLGESIEDRVELALMLRELDVDAVPINILTPIPGTPMESVPPLPPLEILKTVACFRFALPHQHITIAGGRPKNLRDLQPMALIAGATGLMVGNYLTTLNRPIGDDLQLIRDLELELVDSLGRV